MGGYREGVKIYHFVFWRFMQRPKAQLASCATAVIYYKVVKSRATRLASSANFKIGMGLP